MVMSRKASSTQLRAEHIQTNAPEYQEMLNKENLRGMSTGNSPTSGVKPQDFHTPKVHSAKSKVKANVIHKEILGRNTQQLIPSNGLQTTSSSRSQSDSVPTAHVIPNPASQSLSSKYHEYSTHLLDLKEPKIKRSASTTDFSQVLLDPLFSGYSAELPVKDDQSHKRWHSIQNIAQDEEFHELMADPNPTLDQSQFDVTQNLKDFKKFSSLDRVDKIDIENFDKVPLMKDTSATTEPLAKVSPVKISPAKVTPASAEMQFGYPYAVRDLYMRKENQRAGIGAGGYSSIYGQTYSYDAPSSIYSHGYDTRNYTSQSISGYSNHSDTLSNQVLAGDLTQWQLRHQDQLRRQQLEASQPVYSGQRPESSLLSTHTSAVSHLLAGDPHKLDAVKRAADSIIKEKDNIIDKQKMKILQLEQQSKATDLELQHAMCKKAQEECDTLSMKLQEAHYDNASLKAQLTEIMSSKGHNFQQLEKKLGEAEFELQQVRMKTKNDMRAKNREVTKLEEKLSSGESQVLEWQEKYNEMKEDYELLKKKLDSTERYIADLPTADEHHRKSSEVKSLKDDKSKYKHKISELDKRLSDANKSLKARDALIEALEKTSKEMQEHMTALQEENSRLREEIEGLQNGASHQDEDIDELKYENQRLKSDCDKAKKLLEGKHKKMQQIQGKHQTQVKELEERLAQEEESVTALKQELTYKDTHLKKLRTSIKEVSTQNQDLMEKNLVLQDKVKEAEKLTKGEVQKLEKKLLKEMCVCFHELQSLTQICIQRAEGQDPNISVLLGFKASSVPEPEEDPGPGDVPGLKHKVAKVHELRQDIDKLREIISNKYAEDMGDNLNCTTQ